MDKTETDFPQRNADVDANVLGTQQQTDSTEPTPANANEPVSNPASTEPTSANANEPVSNPASTEPTSANANEMLENQADPKLLWKPSAAQIDLKSIAKSSKKPLSVPWKCKSAKCPLGDDYPNILVPQNAIVIGEQIFCGDDILFVLNGYRYLEYDDQKYIIGKEVNHYACVGGKLVCENPDGCITHVRSHTLDVAFEINTLGKKAEICKDGRCPCGENVCSQYQQCMDGNCWFNGKIANGSGDFAYLLIANYLSWWSADDDEEEDGDIWMNDVGIEKGPDLTGIRCMRPEGCWTVTGIHYPQGAFVGLNDDLAHDDSGMSKEFGSPEKASKNPHKLCDSASCACGEKTCKRGEYCQDGACRKLTCAADPADIVGLQLDGTAFDESSSTQYIEEYYIKCREVYDRTKSYHDLLKEDYCKAYNNVGQTWYIKECSDEDADYWKNYTNILKNRYLNAKIKIDEPWDYSDEMDVCTKFMNPQKLIMPKDIKTTKNDKNRIQFRDNGEPFSTSTPVNRQDEKAHCEDRLKSVYTSQGCYCNGIKRSDDDEAPCVAKITEVPALTNWESGPDESKYAAGIILRQYEAPFAKAISDGAVCDVSTGCLCNAQKCPMSGRCTADGCVDPLTSKAFVMADGYFKAGLYHLCAADDGCSCDKSKCNIGQVCLNGYCSSDFEARLHHGKRRISESVSCINVEDAYDSESYACYRNTAVRDGSIDGGWYEVAAGLYGVMRCALPGGCACGDSTCPQYAQCVAGQCYYDMGYERDMCGIANLKDYYSEGWFMGYHNENALSKPAHHVDVSGRCVCTDGTRLPSFHADAHNNPLMFTPGNHCISVKRDEYDE